MSEAIDRYVHENETRFLEELKDLLRIPSISTSPEHNEATHRAADFVSGLPLCRRPRKLWS